MSDLQRPLDARTTSRPVARLFVPGAVLAACALLVPGASLALAGHSAVLAHPVVSQDRLDELTSFVDRQLAEAVSDDPGLLWERAVGLRAAADALGSGQVDAILDGRLAAALEPGAQLLAVAARAQGEGADLKLLAEKLVALVDGSNERVAVVAAEMLAKRLFAAAYARPERLELAGRLLVLAKNPELGAHVRVATAQSAHFLGSTTEKRSAREILQDFLDSTRPEVRGYAALALAATGESIAGRLQLELDALSRLPGDSARLAEAYMRIEDMRRVSERRVSDMQRRMNENLLPDELSRFQDVLDMIERRHLDGKRFDRGQLVDAAMNGMLHLLDEHSTYLSPDSFAKFIGELEAEYGGIGAYVQIDPSDNLFTITRPIYSGPAYRAGLQSDDKIVRIGDWPTLGHPSEEVIKRLKGEPGTDVELYIWRRGMDVGKIDRPDETMIHVIERQAIHVPAVQADMLPGGVALIELTTFSRGVGAELAATAERMLEGGATSFVIDLRRNSGGLLSEAVEVANVFLPRGTPVVHTEYREGPRQTLSTRRDAVVPADVPVAVLISRFTASASEIVAGALQDHERAVLVGKRSFGKGSVQNLLPLENSPEDRWIDANNNGLYDAWEKIEVDHDGDGEFDFAPRVKLTIARYLLPSGRSIHREVDTDGTILSDGGVRPDIEVDEDRIEGWRWSEMRRVRDELRLPREYADTHWEANRELFAELARTDFHDPDLWPDFDELYLSNKTALSREDLRSLLRAEVRRRVQDERGAAFPLGDFQEDSQVQSAIEQVYERAGKDWSQVREFAASFADPAAAGADDEQDGLLARVAADRALERLLDRLRASREQGLGPEEISELIALIEARADSSTEH
ncbi:Carboxy-terminal processing protease CtpA precursor [Planctomycetes bacterium Pla163]|uniref:Carboxy-terminal processing protease CtpA n=1 Tax=Rohdeia mirabilis TaxID=2528008 RepID=A0A518D0A2_9BACT|nr:Carboxy-terminal processing protease CtpA precursor [Planctomycetes bacterium Pla163]